MEQVSLVLDNLKSLGSKKLAALALVFGLIVSVVLAGTYYLSRPNEETLYAGLDRDDVSRIGAALKEMGVTFDVNPEGTAVLVPYGQTGRARMLLAERGLPQSANAGYELFDKVGALGLTSFMQEVTRVRAIEGELARTIQSMRGVKAARVHIVMPDEGSFRRAKQPPSASVVIRTEGPDDSSAAHAIRHLVASAMPGMSIDQVTVLNTDGMILSATDGDPSEAVPTKTLALEKSVAKDIQDNVRRTLTPYLRLPNFQVSVRARVNTDRRQTNETIYDPESKVERSTRTVKESSLSQNASNSSPTTVERNVPQPPQQSGDGKQSNDENKKHEELTNYEVSTKTVTTVSGGYTVENLAIAVLINRAALAEAGKPAPSADVIERQVKEIEQIVASAAGVRKERGDVLKVSAVEFTFNEHEMNPVESPGVIETLSHYFGTMINAATMLAITAALVIFGLMPATRALLAEAPQVNSLQSSPLLGIESEAAGDEDEGLLPQMNAPTLAFDSDLEPFAGIGGMGRVSSRQKLEQLIEIDEMQAASVLKRWMRSDEAA
ncbi:flagellar basal-body MS-ring/collar protein FliF [Methylocystis sp. JR02]|uniref:flagellar basal-body MS-ring/collar protein FliF n=1 Tax=Methylocystis sp. JR02 TaxID=3046284 RepID=UPI0024B926EB|nr:flagellar basal-body MS-ring/collar protein FliF [Methylocystis sp. JR02]MDJ0449466.1 flagellar basal-body MS-ring/collar protein FliF [Methylocystis sp. JR02]